MSRRPQRGNLQYPDTLARSLIEQHSGAAILNQTQRLRVDAQKTGGIDQQIDIVGKNKMRGIARQQPEIQSPPLNTRPTRSLRFAAGGNDRMARTAQRTQQVAAHKTCATRQ